MTRRHVFARVLIHVEELFGSTIFYLSTLDAIGLTALTLRQMFLLLKEKIQIYTHIKIPIIVSINFNIL